MNEIEFRTGVIKPVECMKEGWALIKDDYWLIFAIVLVGMLIGGLIPFGIGIGAMFCGIYFVLFKKLDGEKYEFQDLFKGFNYFVPGLVATLVIIIPMIISMIILYGSMIGVIFAIQSSGGSPNEAAIFGMISMLMVEGVAISLLLGSLHALVMFAYPLIVDFELSGTEAFKLSAKAVWQNLSGVVGIILVEFGMGVVGYMALGVGLYFVLPIMFAGVLVAYRRVFPKPFKGPPPPNIYQDAGVYN